VHGSAEGVNSIRFLLKVLQYIDSVLYMLRCLELILVFRRHRGQVTRICSGGTLMEIVCPDCHVSKFQAPAEFLHYNARRGPGQKYSSEFCKTRHFKQNSIISRGETRSLPFLHPTPRLQPSRLDPLLRPPEFQPRLRLWL